MPPLLEKPPFRQRVRARLTPAVDSRVPARSTPTMDRTPWRRAESTCRHPEWERRSRMATVAGGGLPRRRDPARRNRSVSNRCTLSLVARSDYYARFRTGGPTQSTRTRRLEFRPYPGHRRSQSVQLRKQELVIGLPSIGMIGPSSSLPAELIEPRLTLGQRLDCSAIDYPLPMTHSPIRNCPWSQQEFA
jgi:hypothetical protein